LLLAWLALRNTRYWHRSFLVRFWAAGALATGLSMGSVGVLRKGNQQVSRRRDVNLVESNQKPCCTSMNSGAQFA
jgi:hypothetical protein